MVRVLLPVALLFILAICPALAQRTMTVVSSDPADSSIQAEAFNYSYGGGRSWLVINPIALFNGSTGAPAKGIAPYAHVAYFREITPENVLGGGLDLSLKGEHPGFFIIARGFSDPVRRLFFGAWNFSYRTFGDAGELWNLSYFYGMQGMIANKIVISAMAGGGYSKASAPNPNAYPGAPTLESGFGFQFGGEIGYLF